MAIMNNNDLHQQQLRTFQRLAEAHFASDGEVLEPARLFISHASEDKETFVRSLAEALIDAGFFVWFDEYSLSLGDSLKQQIDAGLSQCNFGIVILSHAFFAKRWPKEELDGLTTIENVRNTKNIRGEGGVKLRKLLVGYPTELV